MNAIARLAVFAPAVLIAVLPCLAPADPRVGIRQGRHGDMGRLVFDFSGRETFHSRQDGGTLTIEFTPAEPIGSPALHIPGMEAIEGGSGIARLQLAPGAKPYIYRLGNRVVVDASPPQAAKRVKALPASLRQAAETQTLPVAAAQGASPAALPPAAGPQPDPQTASLAAPAASTAAASTAQTINFATQPGAAAFRRGDQAIIVFDTSEVPDLTALQSAPIFSSATLLSLQDAQVISIKLPAADSLAVTPVAGGWQVAAVAAAQPGPAPPQNAAPVVDFPMQSANQSIIITDPLTGGDLLVGTATQAGDAADFRAFGPGYAVLPAWLGVAILPLADDLALNASLKGFELVSEAPNGLPLGPLPPIEISQAATTNPGQSMNLPHGSTADLWKHLVADQLAAAMLPPLGRLGAQITLAQDMLALGMGPEAAGVLDTAVLEDPAAQDNGEIAEMRAVAGVLSHRSKPGDFAAPGIVPGTEAAFWQSVGAVDQGHPGAAMAGLIAGLPLFESYPDALRAPVDAEIAEALADNGQVQAAEQLAGSDPGNHLLDLARARILERQGRAEAALAAYQMLACGADDRVSAIAEDRVVELLHAAGRLSDVQAADALDAQLFDWRAPQHERHLRLRIAELRAAGGQWMQAFSMLQSARGLFPGHRGEIDGIRAAMFLDMLKANAFTQLSPIEAVAILQQNQDLIPQGSTQVIDLLAQRLDALDLPGTAAPILSHLIQTVPPGTAQAGLGATLAQIDLDAGSPVAALADLAQTEADNLPQNLAAQRDMLHAKAQAAAGNAVAAFNSLAAAMPAAQSATGAGSTTNAQTLHAQALDAQALDAQAQIAEQSGQWPQAEQALSALVGQSVPAAGPITGDQENLLLRLATAASHNNDSATLLSLSSQYGARMNGDAAGQMFQTLTAPPLTGDQGLNQALHEIAQLQALPAMVDAVTAAPAGATKQASAASAPP